MHVDPQLKYLSVAKRKKTMTPDHRRALLFPSYQPSTDDCGSALMCEQFSYLVEKVFDAYWIVYGV